MEPDREWTNLDWLSNRILDMYFAGKSVVKSVKPDDIMFQGFDCDLNIEILLVGCIDHFKDKIRQEVAYSECMFSIDVFTTRRALARISTLLTLETSPACESLIDFDIIPEYFVPVQRQRP